MSGMLNGDNISGGGRVQNKVDLAMRQRSTKDSERSDCHTIELTTAGKFDRVCNRLIRLRSHPIVWHQVISVTLDQSILWQKSSNHGLCIFKARSEPRDVVLRHE